ncbi:unnamed protein product, partial [Phaedon cochleariae]
GNLEGNISEDLTVISTGFTLTVVVTKFRYHQKRWSRFFQIITDFREFGKPTTFDEITAKTNFYCTIYMIYCISGVMFYGAVSRFESTCYEISPNSPYRDFCGTFTPIWLPMETLPISLKVVLSLIQYMLATHVTTGTAISCAVTYTSTEYLISHKKYLKEKLLRVYKDDGFSKFDKLKFCVDYHNHILGISRELDYLTNVTSGSMSLLCSIGFGCISNAVLKGKPFSGVVYLIGFVVALFLLCYSGQRLLEESLTVGDVAYETEWYTGTSKMAKLMQVIIARSQTPVTLAASPCGIYSIPLFVMILKASYSYMTLLSQST